MHGQRVKLILKESKLVTCKQLEAMYLPSQNKDIDCDLEDTNKVSLNLIQKLQVSSTEVPVYNVLEDSQSSFVTHVNVKKIHSKEFQLKSQSDKIKHVFQMDYAMVYQCKYQGGIHLTLWSCSSVNLFTRVLTNNRKTMTMVIYADYKAKDKAATGMFLDLLCKKYIPINDAVLEEIKWSDQPTLECRYIKVLNPFKPSRQNSSFKYSLEYISYRNIGKTMSYIWKENFMEDFCNIT